MKPAAQANCHRGRPQDQARAEGQFGFLRRQSARTGAGGADRRRRHADGERRDPAARRRAVVPISGIGAKPGIERSRLQQWLCFIGTELHKGLFTPLLGKTVPAEVKSLYAGASYLSRLDYLNKLS